MAGMAQPIRVAQVLNRMDSGGIEAVVINYYRQMDRSRVQFDFFFAAGSALPQRQELQAMGAGLYELPPYSHAAAYHRALTEALRRGGYKIVHVHLSTMSVFALAAARRAGVPVRICHNHSTAHWGEGKKTLLKYLLRPFNRLFATDRFACGERAGRWMYGDRCFARGGVTVLPNAIDTVNFAYDPAARARVRAELGIPQEAFVVGHVGRFVYQKNHELMLEIFAQLRKIRPEARLLLLGEGEREEEMRALAARLGLGESVIFAGVRQDAAQVYSAMDVFCLPSRYEGMPLVAWEAQANGLPCVLSGEVSPEAVCGPNAVQIALPPKETPTRWAEALLAARRADPPTVPDIHREAARLEEFYLRRQAAAEKENGA
jgi:glycosyltransferase involved in cell wall biosynthesis